MNTKDDLPTHYINTFVVQNGQREIYLTLGLIEPETREMKPVFRCVMTGDCLKDITEALFQAYHAYSEGEAQE